MPIKGAILDIDGTLVDSNDAHAKAWVEAFRQNGYDVPYGKVRRLIGMGSDQMLPATVGVEKESEQGKKLGESWEKIFEAEYLPHLRAFPRTRELLEAMKQRGLKLVVASSSEEEMLKKLLKIAGADGLVEDKTSSADAEQSKPAPDIVSVALKRIDLPPGEVLMLGDTPYDIEAARKAGVSTVAVRCGGWNDDGLEGAIAIYDDPADLLAHLDETPFMSGGRENSH